MTRLLFQEHATEDAHGVTYTPFIDTETKIVGFACDKRGRETEFLYFNPSSDDDADPPQSNAFIYLGTEGHPANDPPCVHIVVHDEPTGGAQ